MFAYKHVKIVRPEKNCVENPQNGVTAEHLNGRSHVRHHMIMEIILKESSFNTMPYNIKIFK
jgi:hypothetical protein